MNNDQGKSTATLTTWSTRDGLREVRTGFIPDPGNKRPYQWWIVCDDHKLMIGTRRKGDRRFASVATLPMRDVQTIIAMLNSVQET